ncbi:MAG: type II secretion system protein [Alphaproteobacteria bacterium]
MKKGFTLVELLVVVAILGILAAVGIVSFGGFLGSAKENASRTNHTNMVKFIETQMLLCWTQGYINLISNGGNPVTFYCGPPQNPNRSVGNFPQYFVDHFRGTKQFKNPYDTSIYAAEVGQNCKAHIPGRTNIFSTTTVITIWTQSDSDTCHVSEISE